MVLSLYCGCRCQVCNALEGKLILPQDHLSIFSWDKALDCWVRCAGSEKANKQQIHGQEDFLRESGTFLQ